MQEKFANAIIFLAQMQYAMYLGKVFAIAIMSALPPETERPPVGKLVYEIDLRPAMSAEELLAQEEEANRAGESLERRALRLLREDLAKSAAA